jgi:hypothetical protein
VAVCSHPLSNTARAPSLALPPSVVAAPHACTCVVVCTWPCASHHNVIPRNPTTTLPPSLPPPCHYDDDSRPRPKHTRALPLSPTQTTPRLPLCSRRTVAACACALALLSMRQRVSSPAPPPPPPHGSRPARSALCVCWHTCIVSGVCTFRHNRALGQQSVQTCLLVTPPRPPPLQSQRRQPTSSIHPFTSSLAA